MTQISKLNLPIKTDGVSYFTGDECNKIAQTIDHLVEHHNEETQAATAPTAVVNPVHRDGIVPPPAGLGVSGDTYHDTTAGKFYQKVGGAYLLRAVTKGTHGKSAHQHWLDEGNTGSVAAFLASLEGRDGNDATPAVITNEMLAADIKTGSLAAAANAFPAVDRFQLTTTERFLVWLGGNVTNMIQGLAALATRVKTLEDRPLGTGTGTGFMPTTTGDGTKFLNDRGQYSTPASPGTGTSPGTGAGLPEQSAATQNHVLRSSDSTASWSRVQEFLVFPTVAQLQAYPEALRRNGQPARVTTDPVLANNGDYRVLADGFTWQRDGAEDGFTALTAQTPVAAGRYYEYTLSTPRIWKAKAAQTPGAVMFPVESDAAGEGGAFWTEVSRSTASAPSTGTGGVVLRNTSVIKFDRDADHAPISTGTISFDLTGAQVGVVVFAYLGVSTTQPAIPAGFQLLFGSYRPNRALMYAFRVANNGRIQYTISQLAQ